MLKNIVSKLKIVLLSGFKKTSIFIVFAEKGRLKLKTNALKLIKDYYKK
jgi:hypothetical protein